MSPRFSLVAAVTLSLVGASLARAQSITSIGIAAGATIPTSDYGNENNTGFHGMVTLDVHPPLVPLGARIDGMFNELDVRSSLGASGKTHVWAATANLVLSPAGFAGPYLIGGGGVYHQSVPSFGLSQAHTSDKAGLNVGAGFRIGLTGFYAFAEARYHKVLDDPAQFVPVSFGVVF